MKPIIRQEHNLVTNNEIMKDTQYKFKRFEDEYYSREEIDKPEYQLPWLKTPFKISPYKVHFTLSDKPVPKALIQIFSVLIH